MNSFFCLGIFFLLQNSVLIVLGASILAVAVLVVFKLSSRKKAYDSGDEFQIGPDKYDPILTSALEMRSSIEIGFERTEQVRQTFTCTLMDMTSDHLLLEVPGFVSVSPSWIGKGVVAFFSLRLPKQNQTFYHFRSAVFDVDMDGDLPMLKISLPAKLELKQKRNHLRIDPLHAHVLDVRLWTAHSVHTPDEFLFHHGPPLAEYRKNTKSPILVRDISAGGIRLEIRPDQLAVSMDQLRRHRRFFLYLKLKDPATGKDLSFYLLSRTRNLFQNFDSRSWEMGLEFQLQGFESDRGRVTSWTKISPEHGLEELGNWIFKRHIELYREKGLT